MSSKSVECDDKLDWILDRIDQLEDEDNHCETLSQRDSYDEDISLEIQTNREPYETMDVRIRAVEDAIQRSFPKPCTSSSLMFELTLIGRQTSVMDDEVQHTVRRTLQQFIRNHFQLQKEWKQIAAQRGFGPRSLPPNPSTFLLKSDMFTSVTRLRTEVGEKLLKYVKNLLEIEEIHQSPTFLRFIDEMYAAVVLADVNAIDLIVQAMPWQCLSLCPGEHKQIQLNVPQKGMTVVWKFYTIGGTLAFDGNFHPLCSQEHGCTDEKTCTHEEIVHYPTDYCSIVVNTGGKKLSNEANREEFGGIFVSSDAGVVKFRWKNKPGVVLRQTKRVFFRMVCVSSDTMNAALEAADDLVERKADTESETKGSTLLSKFLFGQRASLNKPRRESETLHDESDEVAHIATLETRDSHSNSMVKDADTESKGESVEDVQNLESPSSCVPLLRTGVCSDDVQNDEQLNYALQLSALSERVNELEDNLAHAVAKRDSALHQLSVLEPHVETQHEIITDLEAKISELNRKAEVNRKQLEHHHNALLELEEEKEMLIEDYERWTVERSEMQKQVAWWSMEYTDMEEQLKDSQTSVCELGENLTRSADDLQVKEALVAKQQAEILRLQQEKKLLVKEVKSQRQYSNLNLASIVQELHEVKMQNCHLKRALQTAKIQEVHDSTCTTDTYAHHVSQVEPESASLVSVEVGPGSLGIRLDTNVHSHAVVYEYSSICDPKSETQSDKVDHTSYEPSNAELISKAGVIPGSRIISLERNRHGVVETVNVGTKHAFKQLLKDSNDERHRIITFLLPSPQG